jgi:hypothetical protein
MTALSDERLEGLRGLYADATTIAVVGCSSDPLRAANSVPRYMREHGHTVLPSTCQDEFIGERCFASLREIDRKVDIVQVFRPSEEAPAIADAVAIGASCPGCSSLRLTRPPGRARRWHAGRMDRCMALSGSRSGYGLHSATNGPWPDPRLRVTGARQLLLEVKAGPAAGARFNRPGARDRPRGRRTGRIRTTRDWPSATPGSAAIATTGPDLIRGRRLHQRCADHEQPLTIGDVIQLETHRPNSGSISLR